MEEKLYLGIVGLYKNVAPLSILAYKSADQI